MRSDISEILIDERAIASRLDELAIQLSADYRNLETTVIPLLNGSYVFAADLLRRIPLPFVVAGWQMASYRGETSTGSMEFLQPPPDDLEGRHILILDDILDTGLTLRSVKETLAKVSRPASIRTCVLLKKNVPRPPGTDADYVGFEIPDAFVVGYGLDYNGRFRNFPHIAIPSPSAIEKYR